MTLAQRVQVEAASNSVFLAETPEELSAFRRPDCAAAIWRRDPAPSFRSWIDGLHPDVLPSARVTLRPKDAREVVTQICEACGTPGGPERRMLVDDTAAVAEIFGKLMGARFLKLRFDVIATNACRRFHIDTVTARLVCTYRGTGTQYAFPITEDDPSEVFTVETGSPILLRGKLWPERPNSGLRHRSPPIEGTGETRLILVLDPIIDPEDIGSPRQLH